jgi:ribosome-binding protein aMBF1 (putative translation factor)
MAPQKTRAHRFMEEQLKDPEVATSFYEGLEELRLAVQIAQLREKRGFTQTQLAAQLHTSPAVISRIENGGNVELKTLQKIARALGARLMIEPVEA